MNQLNETEIIQLFKPRTIYNPEVIIGIGDDCAVLEKNATHYTLISKDLLLEDIHFRLSTSNPAAIAQKAIHCNLSDIAACGGIPLYILLGISCPNNTPKDWLETFALTVKNICEPRKITIIGGDTTGSPDKLYMSITVIGEVEKKHLKLRSTTKVGDYLAVTGNLGDSALGLFALESKQKHRKFAHSISRHTAAIARCEEGKWLGSQKAITAMMDISDGLDTDLNRMIKAANAGAEIEVSRLPYRNEFLQLTKECNLNLYELLLGGGEDYELLIAIDPLQTALLQTEFAQHFKTPLTVIGKITSEPQLRYLQKGIPVDLQFKNFNHFGA
jgi:thiamine-monophosphate kinase